MKPSFSSSSSFHSALSPVLSPAFSSQYPPSSAISSATPKTPTAPATSRNLATSKPQPPTPETKTTYIMETEKLSAYFGVEKVLKEVSLLVRSKEILAIIGPSGCGKSTFLRCLNRLHEETSPQSKVEGFIRLEGRNIYTFHPVELRQHIGMIFQKPNPFPSMSIWENIALGLRLKGQKNRSELADRVEQCLKDVGLWQEVSHQLKKPATSLSGGQQQRLCIARALAVEPLVLLMDEPTSALDPISTTKIEELLHELRQQKTIIIVTHNMQQASRISNWTAFFLMGELIEFSPTKYLFTNPQKKTTERYISGRFG